MESEILADTSVLINLQRGEKEAIKTFRKNVYGIGISRITTYEFIYGSRNKREKEINKNFLNKLNIVELDEEISELAYELLDRYCLKVKLDIPDALIAATAISYNMKLWTENTKHFKLVKELKLFQKI